MEHVQSAEGVLDSRERPFATSHLLSNLRHRTISSGLVTFFAQAIQFGLTLASTAILARLLNPHDYGLIAMVATVLGFLRIFTDAGLTTVTVQREGITNAQVSNLFWVNVLVGSSITALIAVSAPVIAWFYREPDLVAITLALSVTFLMAGLTAQHTALLQRQMRFVAIAVIQLGSMLFAMGVGIGMAWNGFGHWALVGLQVAQASAVMIITWIFSGWRPQLPARGHSMRALVSFGAHLTATSFIWSLARGMDGLLLGRVFGSASLGLYSRAGALLNRPLEQVLGPMHSVFVPVFSRIQSDEERYRRTYLQVFEAITLGSFLVTGLFLALSYPLTVFVLGQRWEMAADIFMAFALSAIFLPLNSATSWLLASQGRGKEWMKASALCGLVAVASFGAGLTFGPVGVAAGYSLGGLFIVLPIMFYFAGRQGPVTTAQLYRATLQHLPVWGAVCVAASVTQRFVDGLPTLAQLAVSGTVGILVGLAVIWISPPARRVAKGLVQTIRGFRMEM